MPYKEHRSARCVTSNRTDINHAVSKFNERAANDFDQS